MTSPAELFAGGGETGRRMAGLDWSATPVGPVARWSQSMRSAVRIVLSSRYPMLLLWGPQFTQLYNDAYSALIGDKHPAALGNDVRVTLAEGWDVLGPLVHEAMATGVASWVPALRLLLERSGYREEAYFSVSHAPARDDDGRTVGVLAVCSEVTEQVVGERRLRLLRDLSLQGDGRTVDVADTCARLSAAIGGHPLDVPFAAIYVRDGDSLRMTAAVGTAAGGGPVGPTLPATVTLSGAEPDVWCLRPAAAGAATETGDVVRRLTVPAGPWDDPVVTAVALPLPSAEDRPLGVLLAGVSPSRGLDEAYRSFFALLAQQVSVAVRNARAYEEERRRAEALAELDRVKTSFFTNVSHEFRTPLTLMLGPLSDALNDHREALSGTQRDRVETAWHNATRLLTLVNNLLTFASLEAGRAGSTAREVDLAELTTELAGVFRAAVERAGLRLEVDCPPLPRPVAVDPANWEKIVTNLMSNALKFTFVGRIRVTLDADDEGLRLRVSDTGIGIPSAEVPRLFERFHRVQGSRSRSHEGTGIGLALVRELTVLQGGDVRVDSAVGTGTTFTVALPWTAVKPPVGAPDGVRGGLVGETARASAREAYGWLTPPEPGPAAVQVPPESPAAAVGDRDDLAGARILVADDNNDMRRYLSRLLAAEHWQVETVADGREALDAIRRHPPDLLLTDVMMPVLDGFGLVRTLRREEATRGLPIVVLSARAGREAGVEGLDLGADDYVVKPFAAAELIARLRTTMRLARVRGAHDRQLSALADTAAVIASGRALEDAVCTITEQARLMLDGVQAVTVLDGGDGRPPLRFATAAAPGPEPATEPEVAVIEGRQGRRLGTIVVRRDSARRSTDGGRALLVPVARMLAALAEHTWQVEREQHVALTLQQSLLPERLPTLDGWELTARYLPASDSGEVGGDWYDVLTLPDGSAVVNIGDVAGHGLGAAVTMGQLRNAIRAYAVQDPSPDAILDRLTALLTRLRTPSFATLFVGHLDPGSGTLTWCSAGHPPPVHDEPGRPAGWLAGAVGPPLGVAGGTPVTNRTVLQPGARLLLYTDGLVEERGRDIDAGLRRLLSRTTTATNGDPPLREIVDAVLAAAPQPRRDDVAVLALHRHPPVAAPDAAPVADVDESWTYPLAPTAAAAMRRAVRAALSGSGIHPDVLDDLLLAASEAVNNAVEHAQRPSRPEVEVQVRISAGVARIAVQDFGSWRSRQPAMDRGRGALLMNAYGDVRVVSTSTGTLVVIERRLGVPAPAR